MSCHAPLRRYQHLAVEAFDQARASGSRTVYLVLPPGAGKTVLGLEVARQLGRRTLALCPNTAVQSRWLRRWQVFEPSLVAAGSETDSDAPFLVLTYQAICNLEDNPALDDRALALWHAALEADEHLTPEEADTAIQSRPSANGLRDAHELAHFRPQTSGGIARDGTSEDLLGLLHPNARTLVERMKANSP